MIVGLSVVIAMIGSIVRNNTLSNKNNNKILVISQRNSVCSKILQKPTFPKMSADLPVSFSRTASETSQRGALVVAPEENCNGRQQD